MIGQSAPSRSRAAAPRVVTGRTCGAAAVVVAAGLDAAFREPPLPVHPVRLAGRYLDVVQRFVPSGPRGRAVAAGGLAWTAGAVAAAVTGALADRASMIDWSRMVRHAGVSSPVATVRSWPGGVVPAVVAGVALWPLFAHRLLLDEVAAVEDALAAGLDEGRAAVGRIVSRDVSAARAEQVREAAIESLAENLSDSVVAPLLWFAAGGLPAVATYRFANTADAAWGYRTERWRYAGRVAARADDALNLLPARLTALAIAGRRVPWSDIRREAARTPSPNAGWPMAAMALRLGLRLEKPGVYVLNAGGRPPEPADTRAALRLARRCGWAAAGVAAALASTRERRCRR